MSTRTPTPLRDAPRSVSGRDVRSGQLVTIQIEAGRIRAIEPGGPETGLWLATGLIDLQVNGYAGHDVNAADVSPATIVALTQALWRVGVTTYLPTIITASEPRIVAALRAIAQARRDDPRVAHAIPAVHVEGPHISPLDGPRGAHPAADVRDPDLGEFLRWQTASDGLVGMVTLSPHSAGAAAYIAGLAEMGVHVAIGHTHAEPEAITRAVTAGARLSTHLGNGIAAMLPRHPNAIWTQLAEDRLTKTFIADGHHLPADTLKAMLRAAGLARSVLVSDVTALGGLPAGLYDQPVGGQVELREDGRLGVVGTPFLAGAARPLIAGVETLLGVIGLDLSSAFALVTENPGRFVGGRGRLEVGADADLIVFRRSPDGGSLDLELVLSRGAVVP